MEATPAVHTADEIVEEIKKQALRKVTFAAGQLSRLMSSIMSDAARAREELAQGRYLTGSSNFGPIGHQSPFDVANYNRMLSDAIEYAVTAGATQAEIADAQKRDLR